jgi:hypothetical protein
MFPGFRIARRNCSCKHIEKLRAARPHTNTYPEEAERLGALRDIQSADPVSMSPSGTAYDEIGCFPVGADVSLDDFQEIVFSQRNLRKLELVDVLKPSDLRKYGLIFSEFVANTDASSGSLKDILPKVSQMIDDLALTLKLSPDGGSGGIRVFLGLHSGFQHNQEKQFWAVYHCHDSEFLDIYISKNVIDMMGTVLHTFLSSRGFTRRQCFAVEVAFARWHRTLTSPHELPPRVVQDVELMSPQDCLLLLQRLSLAPNSGSNIFLGGLKAALLEKLVDVPSWNQLRTISTIGYLSGDVSVEELIESRIQWYCQYKRSHPDLRTAISLFNDIQEKLGNCLRSRDLNALQTIVSSLRELLNVPNVDTTVEISVLSIFCIMRAFAFEEIYIEVTDRNPLFNDQTDQAAAFSELFATGSRCEAYFNVTQSQFGQLLSKNYRSYYHRPERQPPIYDETQGALASAYAEAQIDVDLNFQDTKMPAYKRFTFLSVFAIPALVDIFMLTMTGHGMYLSSAGFMTFEEQHSATTALMISLLLSGAIGTWITCCRTYYLTSMAFSAMNYFVITRLLGGFASTIIVGLVGFVAFACTISAYAGLIFFLYLVVLTTYLCLLAALANYQFIGTAFLSVSFVIHCL